MNQIFPFAEYWWFYLAFTGFVITMLALDLGVFHRKAHIVSFKEAATWSVVWFSLALLFNVFLYYFTLSKGHDPLIAKQMSLEFLTGYLVEKSLAVDNVFVFVMVFSYFSVPLQYQHRILFYGIFGALIFRAIFIAMGSLLMQYHFVILIFGVFLIFTGVKMMITPEKQIDGDKNLVLRMLRKILPVSPQLEGDHFFVRKNLVWHATPLFVALALIEVSDIVFALDSVPAIFAITKEPMLVFTSNIFAILGLRAMFFMLAGVIHKFYLLKYGLGLVLIFVGLKMSWLNGLYDGKFPIWLSLAVIAVFIFGSIVLSLLIPPKAESTNQ